MGISSGWSNLYSYQLRVNREKLRWGNKTPPHEAELALHANERFHSDGFSLLIPDPGLLLAHLDSYQQCLLLEYSSLPPSFVYIIPHFKAYFKCSLFNGMFFSKSSAYRYLQALKAFIRITLVPGQKYRFGGPTAEHKMKIPGQSFLTLAILTFGARQFLAVGVCPVHFKMSHSIPGLYPLNSGSTSPIMTTQNVSIYCQITAKGKTASSGELIAGGIVQDPEVLISSQVILTIM